MAMAVAIAFGVPVVFLLCGAMGRKLMRGTQWQRSDFYLGVELTLATFSSNVLFLIELLRAEPPDPERAAVSALSLVFVFGLYTYLLTLHQDWERQDTNRSAQIWRLMVLSNLLASVAFAAFVFLIKGIR